jgi:single-strand DNA-binding protein
MLSQIEEFVNWMRRRNNQARTGREAELRYSNGGQAVANVSVAVDDSYINRDGERVDRTVWYNVEFWGKQAEIVAQYCYKGREVYVEGKIKVDAQTGAPRIYQDKSGSWRSSLDLRADNVIFFGERRGDGSTQETFVSEEEDVVATF